MDTTEEKIASNETANFKNQTSCLTIAIYDKEKSNVTENLESQNQNTLKNSNQINPNFLTFEQELRQEEITRKEEERKEEVKVQKLYDDENYDLERKYKRKEGYRLNLLIMTNKIKKYSDNPQELDKEIREKMGIDSITEATVLSSSPDQITVKIRTNNYEHYIKMRESKNWPKTVFGSKNGIHVKIIPIDLQLSITGVDKKKIFDEKTLKNLTKKKPNR